MSLGRPGFRRILVCALLLGAVAVVLVAAPGEGADAKQTPCGRTAEGGAPTARLKVAGKQMQDSHGHPFVPYGISLISGPETTNWSITENRVDAQIVAARRYWHANSIRIQVSQAELFDNPTPGHNFNVPFAQSVNRLVCLVLSQHQIPIISENSIFTGRDRGPTEMTRRFWDFMSRRYGNKIPAIFDLFNEPQVTQDPPATGRFLDPVKAWGIWRDGARVAGIKYLGMQALVDEIRNKQHVGNVIWAEQPYYVDLARTRLDLLASHLLKGADIVYAFHKLQMQPDSDSFRVVPQLTGHGIPLVSSEWTQFAATDRPWMCQPDAYKTTPGFLAMLRADSIGVLAWSLQPGALVKGQAGVDTVHDGNDYRYTTNPRDLAKPTVMKPSYGCTPSARGQGAGKLIQEMFARYAKPAPADLFPRFG